MNLPEDVLPLVFASLGNHSAGFVEQLRKHRVCKQFNAVPTRLPRDKTNPTICTVDVSLLPTFFISKNLASFSVIDVTADRRQPLITIGCMPEVLLFAQFRDKPSPSSRLYRPEDRLVWCPPGTNVRLSMPYDPDDASVADLVRRPLTFWKFDDVHLREAMSNVRHTLMPRSYKPVDGTQDALDAIARALDNSANADVSSLVLTSDLSQSPPLNTTTLASTFCHLSRVSFDRVKFDDVASVFECAVSLTSIEFSCCQFSSGRIVVMSYNLLRGWSRRVGLAKDAYGITFEDCVLDCHHPRMPIIIDAIMFLCGLGCATTGSCELVDRHTVVTTVSPRIFVSCDVISSGMWSRALVYLMRYASTKSMGAIQYLVTPELEAALRETPSIVLYAPPSPPPPKKNKKLKPPPPPPLPPPPPPPLPPPPPPPMSGGPHDTDYSDPERERDRYMFQWWDYTCYCGTVWPKNSVTISWRQTCVSMCLRGKKRCSERPEYSRMRAGEVFITDRHVNGGTLLSPSPDEVRSADSLGLLVGVHPTRLTRQFFKADPAHDGWKTRVETPTGLIL